MRAGTAALLRLPRAPRLMSWLFGILALHRQRAHILHLDGHLPTDIGPSREEAMHEGARPLWNAPTPWHGTHDRPGRR